jgi:membrane-associated protease RseP (regulator of RpoE activity)
MAAWIVVTLVHLSGFVLASLAFGQKIEEFSLFFGKPILSVPWRGCTLCIRSIPMGGSVTIVGTGYDDDEPHASLPVHGFRALPTSKRLLTFLAGPIVCFLLAIACGGVLLAQQRVLTGFIQVIHGSIAPIAYGQHAVARFLAHVRNDPYYVLLGFLAAKNCSGNLLPLPSLNGGQAIMTLFPNLTSRQVYRMQLWGLIALALLWFGWGCAIFAYVRGL